MKRPFPGFAAIKTKLASRPSAKVEQPGIMETAVALILTPGELGPEALFIRRAQRADDPWSGHIALPGGRRDPGDEDRLATAVRESLEEVGVRLERGSLLGALDDLAPAAPRLPPLVIRPYAFGLESRPATALSDEVAEAMWIPLSELAACESRTTVPIHDARVEVPCFDRNGVVIWGLTYRILRGFLPLLDA